MVQVSAINLGYNPGLEQLHTRRILCVSEHGVDTMLKDLQLALRVLRKSPGFAAAAILTLALGIGANTGIFSLLYGVAFRDLPVPHAEQLVKFGAHVGDDSYVALSVPMFQEIARSQKVFSGMFAWAPEGVDNVEIEGSLFRADIWPVTGNFYPELFATPEIGRLLGPEDVDLQTGTASQIAVLGYSFWQRRYGGDPGVIGTILKIQGIPFTVIGVTRKGFGGISAENLPEVTVPLTNEPIIAAGSLIAGQANVKKSLERRDSLWIQAVGRLKPGITLDQARVQLDSMWPSIRDAVTPVSQSPAERERFLSLRLKAESGATGSSYLRNRFSQPLYLLFSIASIVLLVACVNLGSLTLARTAARGHEISVRLALGASRVRIVRQMLTEAIILSVMGALAGLVFAYWSSRALSDLIIKQIYVVPAEVNVTPDLRIFGFAAVAALMTGILFGLASAWRATREDPCAGMRQSSRVMGGGTGRFGNALIITQVALSLMLLAGAGLFMRTLQKLRATEPGFRTHDLLDVRLDSLPGGYKNLDVVNYYRELVDRVSSLPNVTSAAIVHMQPGGANSWTEKARLKNTEATARVDLDMVMPGAFRTMGIDLLRGRDFTWQDDEHALHVAIVSRSFAEQIAPGKSAIGQSIEITSQPKWPSVVIVGIAADASLYDLYKHAPPTVYLPPMQYGADWSGWGEILIQTSIPAKAMTSPVRHVVESMGREYVYKVETISEGIERSLLRERVVAMISAFFGGLALLLAAIGLYGLMAYNVTRRVREIGIRVALGAQRGVILWMVLREALVLAVVGVASGIACAIAAARWIASMLYGITPYDAATLVGVSFVLVMVAAVAAFLPAYRSARVDPMIALRQD
jgi:predicted permease